MLTDMEGFGLAAAERLAATSETFRTRHPSLGGPTDGAGHADDGVFRIFAYRLPTDPGHNPASILSERELSRADAFRVPRHRSRYVATHIGLRLLLGGLLGIPGSRVPIYSAPCHLCGGDAHGKPKLPSEIGLHFSLARTGDLALYSVHNRPNGIDVEIIPEQGDLNYLLGNLTRNELAAARLVPEDRLRAELIQCWVRKEAFLKATGEGLTRDPRRVEVGIGSQIHGPTHRASSDPTFQLIDLRSISGTAAAVAVSTGQIVETPAITPLMIDPETLESGDGHSTPSSASVAMDDAGEI